MLQTYYVSNGRDNNNKKKNNILLCLNKYIANAYTKKEIYVEEGQLLHLLPSFLKSSLT